MLHIKHELILKIEKYILKMPKIYWHTKTLFIRWWKYKWSNKYDHCINCWTCEKKHKWNGLCRKCWELERDKNPYRVFMKKRMRRKNYYKTRLLKILDKKEKPRRWQIPFLTPETRKKQKLLWYKNNFERISLERKVKRRLKNNLPCLKMIINCNEVLFPFESLEKPKTFTSDKYDEYKEKLKQFEILTAFYKQKFKN